VKEFRRMGLGIEGQAVKEAFFVPKTFRRSSFSDVGRGEDRVVFELSPRQGVRSFTFSASLTKHNHRLLSEIQIQIIPS
jgi:hypothetical protein